MSRVCFMHGNEAAAEGAIAAGCRFYAGYPITPSTEIAEILSTRLPEVGGTFIQMEDEIASMAAVIGASLGGLMSATATSGPGFSLMQENLGFAVASEIPCVIVNVQRVGPSTGLPTKAAQGDMMQARWGTHGDHPIIALTPSSVQESWRLAVRAFALSERYRTPVLLMIDAIVAQLKEKVELPEGDVAVQRPQPAEPPASYKPFAFLDGAVQPLAAFGGDYRYHVTGLLHDEHGFPTENPEIVARWWQHMTSKIDANLDDILEWEEDGLDDADVAVVSYGASARAAQHAVTLLRERGLKAGWLKLLTVWPFPEARMRALAAKVPRIVVPEMNLGQIRLEVERLAAGRARVQGVHRADGLAITPEQIVAAIVAENAGAPLGA
ncbi:MAG: 2-oxoacid:acceptor oxidoreductase subunit alpha [Rubrivivax sp.]|nr:2-oxoacid:acceptor oxidoreductase subunit alpha [Rubrivivax sp.]